jgi:nitrate reductase gamma subunit
MLWHIFTYSSIGLCIFVTAWRAFRIKRLPIHLRWELAPIPHEKGRNQYGGSHLEEYEWWTRCRSVSYIAPLIYMAKEIFLLNAVRENNRTLWPFSFSLHMGIYLTAVTILLQALSAVLIISASFQALLMPISQAATLSALAGNLLGIFGSVGLLFKRIFNADLSPFSSFSKCFNLCFLAAVFLTGGIAWLFSANFTSEMIIFIRDVFTFNAAIDISFATTLHLGFFLLFLIYLPFTDMIHPVVKYFTYHDIRWNDAPLNKNMQKAIGGLLNQPVTWSAAHINADGKTNWVDIVTAENGSEKEA